MHKLRYSACFALVCVFGKAHSANTRKTSSFVNAACFSCFMKVWSSARCSCRLHPPFPAGSHVRGGRLTYVWASRTSRATWNTRTWRKCRPGQRQVRFVASCSRNSIRLLRQSEVYHVRTWRLDQCFNPVKQHNQTNNSYLLKGHQGI